MFVTIIHDAVKAVFPFANILAISLTASVASISNKNVFVGMKLFQLQSRILHLKNSSVSRMRKYCLDRLMSKLMLKNVMNNLHAFISINSVCIYCNTIIIIRRIQALVSN